MPFKTSTKKERKFLDSKPFKGQSLEATFQRRRGFLYNIDIGICRAEGSSIKDVGTFLAVFDTPLPNVGILTLIYLTSTF